MRNLDARRRRWVGVRVGLLGAAVLCAAVLVARRAYELQVERAPVLREMAQEQYLRDIKLAPKRGTIYDRHGTELAVSVEVDSVWANPRAMKKAGIDPEATAARIATVLPIDRDRIAARLSKDRHFVWIDRHVTPQQADRVRALNIDAIHMNQEARRYYPNRELAAHLLGFANIDGEGIEGLELSLEDVLRGDVREVPAIRDRRGNIVFSEQLLDDGAAQGNDVTLTIDKTIQHIAERELELAVRTFEAKAGSVVVMDPSTGELLAVANFPRFNPNEPGKAPVAHRRNRAVTDPFEPGSTVKPFTVAAALSAGTIESEQRIDCEDGAMEVAEYTIHDSHRFGELTPSQILTFSSNIGTAKIGRTLGRRGLYRAMRRFGFGQATELPLPGETRGILRHFRQWYEMDAATISFGQGMSVTTVQLAAAMSALANDGRLMQPMLVKRVSDGGGRIVDETLPRVRRQVVPRSVGRLVGDMLTAVTGPDGTGTEAAIEGYLVAGKTGTAQKADYVRGGYAEDKWLASFVGFVPASAPRLVIAVVVDEPVIAHYGGTVAGPVFRRVGRAALRHLGVPASEGGEALASASRSAGQRNPPARQPADEPDATADADAVREASGAAGQGEAHVPDLRGQTAREALIALRAAGLQPVLEGSGVVVSQDPVGGEVLAEGQPVRIVLAPPPYDAHPTTPERRETLAAAATDGSLGARTSGEGVP